MTTTSNSLTVLNQGFGFSPVRVTVVYCNERKTYTAAVKPDHNALSIPQNFSPSGTAILNNPANIPVTWSVSPTDKFYLTDTTNTSVVIHKKPSGATSGTLTVQYDGGTTIQKTFTTAAWIVNISGSSTVCTGPSTYSLSGLPSGTSVSWSATPANIATVAGHGMSATVTPQSRGTFTLNASVGTGVTGYAITKNIQAGVPVTDLHGIMVKKQWPEHSAWDFSYVVDQGESYYLELAPENSMINMYEWQFFDNITTSYYWRSFSYPFTVGDSDMANDSVTSIGFNPGGSPGDLIPDPPTTIPVRARFRDCMGWSPYFEQVLTINYNLGFSFLVSPNPVSDNLHFSLVDNNSHGSISTLRGVQPFTIQQCDYRVQLYSVASGILAIEQTMAHFNDSFDVDVSSVPGGLYRLILLKGDEIIQQQNIMIQR